MASKKVDKNKRLEGMFTGLKNSAESQKNNIKNTAETTGDMVKNLGNLPWKKLPPFGWFCLVVSFIVMILILFFIYPMVNV